MYDETCKEQHYLTGKKASRTLVVRTIRSVIYVFLPSHLAQDHVFRHCFLRRSCDFRVVAAPLEVDGQMNKVSFEDGLEHAANDTRPREAPFPHRIAKFLEAAGTFVARKRAEKRMKDVSKAPELIKRQLFLSHCFPPLNLTWKQHSS